ncbi:MAG: Uma2 family endonuclease [Deltaproteobacteria bacterium]|nr:Uma2 family endonuclease [Deltaproteobacteria bacterium]
MNTQTTVETTPSVQPLETPTGEECWIEDGQRIILYGISWETYEHLLEDMGDSHAAHFAYDQGALEIMVPTERHERPNRTLALLVEVVAEELNIDIVGLGSTTFKRKDLQKGLEPDSCFYIQNEALVRGKKKLDFTVDPPPDLIIEVDETSSSLNKFPIYARLGTLEVWRYKNNQVKFFALTNGQYAEVENSIAFPLLTSTMTTQFLAESLTSPSTAWLRRVRQWIREARGAEK